MKTYDIDINNPHIEQYEDLIRIERDVDVAKYLPQDIIGKGAEFQNIRRSNNRELSQLWARANCVIKNIRILSSDKTGLNLYEKLIDEEITGDLKEKRKKIYALWNKVLVWTDRTLRKWLDDLLGENNYFAVIEYNEYNYILSLIYYGHNYDTDFIYKQVRLIIPANLGLEIRIYFAEDLILKDKTNTYHNRFYITGHEHQCGTIFRHQYTGKAVRDSLAIRNGQAVRAQRPLITGEPLAETGIRKGGSQ